MDGVSCKLPGIISPLLNRATEAATPPHTIRNVTQIFWAREKAAAPAHVWREPADRCKRADGLVCRRLSSAPQGRELRSVDGIMTSLKIPSKVEAAWLWLPVFFRGNVHSCVLTSVPQTQEDNAGAAGKQKATENILYLLQMLKMKVITWRCFMLKNSLFPVSLYLLCGFILDLKTRCLRRTFSFFPIVLLSKLVARFTSTYIIETSFSAKGTSQLF